MNQLGVINQDGVSTLSHVVPDCPLSPRGDRDTGQSGTTSKYLPFGNIFHEKTCRESSTRTRPVVDSPRLLCSSRRRGGGGGAWCIFPS